MNFTMIRDLIQSSIREGWEPHGLHPSVARRALGVRGFGLTGAALDRFCPLPPELGPDQDFLPAPENWRAYLARRAQMDAARRAEMNAARRAEMAASRRDARAAAYAEKVLPSLRDVAARIRATGQPVTIKRLAEESGQRPNKLVQAFRPGHYLHGYRDELIDADERSLPRGKCSWR